MQIKFAEFNNNCDCLFFKVYDDNAKWCSTFICLNYLFNRGKMIKIAEKVSS